MKKLNNNYQLSNVSEKLSADTIRKVLNDFEFFMANYQQITNKERQTVHFKLNAFQRKLFSTLLPLLMKETRLDRRTTICVIKGRQVGASVGIVAFINYVCAFVDGMQNLNIAHTFPVTDTISKFYQKKVEPIITGVHPDLMPTIERETMGSSIMTYYRDIKGIRRNNYYELISANASSIRSDSLNIVLEDEVAFYSHPEVLDDAIMPALPDYGFSMVVYLSTFDDRKSDFFQKKLKTALDSPEDHIVIFAPWFLTYPERSSGIPLESIELTDYDRDVIIPEMIKEQVPKERWGDCIDWYHSRSRVTPSMKKEYPTTIDEVLEMGQDKCWFDKEIIENQKKNILSPTPMRVLHDKFSNKYIAEETESSPFLMYKTPLYGHRYTIVVDPITSMSADSDIFAMSVFDDSNLEQVAVFIGKDMPLEDYADYAVSMAKIYNNAVILPESNVAEAFIISVRALGYYNFYYDSPANRARKIPGIRTTISSKEAMLDRLTMLLTNGKLILHDKETIDELGWFERKVKNHADGSCTVRAMARKGKHDDLVSCFSGDTMIMTDKGEVPIKDIKIGDMVLTSKGFREVEGVYQKKAKVISKFGTTATPEHVFITPDGEQQWKDIDENSRVYTCHNAPVYDGIDLEQDEYITTIKEMRNNQPCDAPAEHDEIMVYDLTVKDVHEYYANGMLVHNCLWIYAGSLDQKQLTGKSSNGFSFI